MKIPRAVIPPLLFAMAAACTEAERDTAVYHQDKAEARVAPTARSSHRNPISPFPPDTTAIANSNDEPVGTSNTRESTASERWFDLADAFLRTTVSDEGLVFYEKARKDKKELDTLIEGLAPKQSFDATADKLVWHVNAYNLIVIGQVLEHGPLESVQDIKGFFKKIKHRVNGSDLTLSDLEGKILRPLDEPRIHAVLVCGAASCPPLRQGAFTAEKFDEQFDRITRRWINDPTKNRIQDDQLCLSEIFKWYKSDFTNETYRGVVDFLARHANTDSAIARLVTSDSPPPVRYLEYDWSLNAAPED